MMKRFLILTMMVLGLGSYASGQTLRNSNNSTLGTISSDGTVRNSSNSVLGRIATDGTVRNSNNSVIGYAKGIPTKYAALYFFFRVF